jgi:hypothetical protein
MRLTDINLRPGIYLALGCDATAHLQQRGESGPSRNGQTVGGLLTSGRRTRREDRQDWGRLYVVAFVNAGEWNDYNGGEEEPYWNKNSQQQVDTCVRQRGGQNHRETQKSERTACVRYVLHVTSII